MLNIAPIGVVVGYERLDEMPPHKFVAEQTSLDEISNERGRAYEAFPSSYRNPIEPVLIT